ncbi:hypothetical protein PISMIDRAFT_680944, partial [Pisolithus microcarpus 441]
RLLTTFYDGACMSATVSAVFLARSVVVDSRVFLIAEKIFLSRGHQQYQVLPLHVEGLRDRMREEETYFVEIDTKLAKQPAPFVGFTRLLRHIYYALRAVPGCHWRCWCYGYRRRPGTAYLFDSRFTHE